MKTDRQLQADVLKELEWEPSVNAAHVGVAVEDGVVTLTGYIDSYAEKRAAETAVKRVLGVRGVAEKLEVRLPQSSKRTDADLARAAANALEWNVAVPHQQIKIKVENGWVTLDGQVDWAYQRNTCDRLVHALIGVAGVTNLITVRPRVFASDVKTKIGEALKRYSEQETKGIRVETSEGSVTLRGSVHSWKERDEAGLAAWSAPGVSQVDNLISVAP
jgi:osmotically-inducible protein OsmY